MSELLAPRLWRLVCVPRNHFIPATNLGWGVSSTKWKWLDGRPKGMHLAIGLLRCLPKWCSGNAGDPGLLEHGLPAINTIEDVIHRAGYWTRSLRAVRAAFSRVCSYVKRIFGRVRETRVQAGSLLRQSQNQRSLTTSLTAPGHARPFHSCRSSS